jgi:1,4-dihydroxy-2-naphthoate octaprenyltransferase
LMIHRSLRFLKELFIASLYTAGILLLSITTTPVQTGLMHYLVILQFGSIAWANLVLFSWFDVAFDQQNDQNSFVTVLGRRTTEILLIELFALNFIIAIIQLSMAAPIMAVFILIAMNSVLLIIFLFRKVLEKHELYRSIGDAIFMLPAFFLI